MPEALNGIFVLAVGWLATSAPPMLVPVAAAPFTGAVPVPTFNWRFTALVAEFAITPVMIIKILPLNVGDILHVVPSPIIVPVVDVVPVGFAGVACNEAVLYGNRAPFTVPEPRLLAFNAVRLVPTPAEGVPMSPP
jgi:hypothetical protein